MFIVVAIVVFIAIIVVAIVVLWGKKNDVLPPPLIIEGKTILASAQPSYTTHVYRYHFNINLTNSQILASLSWNEDFGKDYPHLLESEYRDLRTKKLNDVVEYAQQTFQSMNTDKLRSNYTVPMEPAMIKQLLGDVEYGRLIHLIAPPEKWSSCNLWLNTGGYTTPLHGDKAHVIAFHLTGRKRWTLADKGNLPNCYPRPNTRGHFYCHAGNPYDKSLSEIYPNFSRIRYRHVDLFPGDLLVIPPKTLHFVHTFEPSFMVSIVLKKLND